MISLKKYILKGLKMRHFGFFSYYTELSPKDFSMDLCNFLDILLILFQYFLNLQIFTENCYKTKHLIL